MATDLRFHVSVIAEIANAIDHYAAISPAIGNDLRKAFQAGFSRIASNPELYAIVYDDIRIMRVKPFPYVIHYRLIGDVPQIVGVFHSATDVRRQREDVRGRKGDANRF